jgi:hypothetical protein
MNKKSKMNIKPIIIGIILLVNNYTGYAQLERKLVDQNPFVELTFEAPRIINLFTVEPLNKNDLHWSIMHTFGSIDNGGRNLWGLDNGANIRLSFEYGINDRWSVGFSRSSLDKVFDFHTRYHLIKQRQDNTTPISVSAVINYAVITNDYTFLGDQNPDMGQRSSYLGQIMIARKFNKKLSIQVSPMVAVFQDVQAIYLNDSQEAVNVALGFSGKYNAFGRSTFTAQFIPNLNNNLRPNFGIGYDLEAGGHVFQMYFVTGGSLNEQYLLTTQNGVLGEGFRLGFNVNRIFTVGKKK